MEFHMKNYIAKKLMNLGHKLSDNHNNIEWIIPDANHSERKIINQCNSYTSSTEVAQWAFIQAIKHVDKLHIPGDIVECGVWKGGNLMIADLMKKLIGFDREIWGYDTFAGMTEPSEFDIKPGFTVNAREKFKTLTKGNSVDWCYVPIEKVAEDLREICGENSIKLIKGDVRETLLDKTLIPQQIAILRLDTDFYESTKMELEKLYPLVPSGGVVIIDDYGIWQGSKKAVDEYFSGNLPWLHYINRGVRLFIKP
jgi:O-methyltransferase